ncbi:Gfo/Idh/MocA family protein [Clostridium sp. Marseille-P3244]|uniref:Gfo/Idh/MocA family protein n=1 Tax=Clostridium sp. Marseille-P3244 TaxID=1871020 RepID=UPI000931E943|nr:Gfo/Idh/MocA family oxidoreductase [Clostridium sp. Marseille-P3244]
MKQYRAAVIGAGFIGSVHTEMLRRLGNVEVCALCDAVDVEKKAVAMNIPHAYSDYRALIDEEKPDVIHICTPNNTHYDIAKYAIEKGVHIVCEKPFTTTVEEAQELVNLAKEKGIKGVVNFHNRLYPMVNEMHRAVADGEVGDVFSVHGEYVQDWLLYDTDYSWRLEKDQAGKTRAVADIGSHWVDLAEFVTGQKIVRINADFKTVYPVRKKPLKKVETFQKAEAAEYEDLPIDTEDIAVIMFETEGGAVGTAIFSMVTAGRKNTTTLHIAGSRKSLSWTSEDLNDLWIGYRDKPNEILTKDASLMHAGPAKLASYPSGHIEGFPDAFKNVFRQFYTSLEVPGDYDYAGLEDGLRDMVLCDKIFESAQKKCWVETR